MRGKYVIGNINGIRGLFNQMVPEELELLRTKTFIELWEIFWGKKNAQELAGKKDFYISEQKFNTLKTKTTIESDLNFYIDTAEPGYALPEWGFPKGRKKRGESDIECALREFEEETGIKSTSIQILRNIKPIKENLTGTDGKCYRHIYFLAEMLDPIENILDINNNDNCEIGDIGFFSYNVAISLLRDYHIEKKLILHKIINYYIELARKHLQKKDDTEWSTMAIQTVC